MKKWMEIETAETEAALEAEVPFDPTPGKPVYCRDCYQKHKKPRRY